MSRAVIPSRLTVLSGPTAVGKGTVVAELRRQHPEIFVSVSANTRPPRPGEVEGTHYLFVSEPEFDRLVAEGLVAAAAAGALRRAVAAGQVNKAAWRELAEGHGGAGGGEALSFDALFGGEGAA